MYDWRAVLGLSLLILGSAVGRSATLVTQSIDKLLDTSDYAFVARVVRSIPRRFTFQDESYTCGFVNELDIIEVVKGQLKTPQAFTPEGLEPGESYLFLVGDLDQRPDYRPELEVYVVLDKPAYFESEEYRRCVNNLPNVGHYEPRLSIFPVRCSLGQRCLEVAAHNVVVPLKVTVLEDDGFRACVALSELLDYLKAAADGADL